MALTKTEMKEIKYRIDNVVQCACGAVSTKLNRKLKKLPVHSDKVLFDMVESGVATIRKYSYLKDHNTPTGRIPLIDALTYCYTFPKPEGYVEVQASNKIIKDREEELHQGIHNAGERLYDAVVLKAITPQEVVKGLERISKMSSAA